jgi:hypothetical protein
MRLTVSPLSKSEFAPRLGQHAEGAVGMEHSRRYLLYPARYVYQRVTASSALAEVAALPLP